MLLQTVSFDLTIEHPYEYLLGYVKALKGDKSLAQYAWNFLNDRCGFPLFLFLLLAELFPDGLCMYIHHTTHAI